MIALCYVISHKNYSAFYKDYVVIINDSDGATVVRLVEDN